MWIGSVKRIFDMKIDFQTVTAIMKWNDVVLERLDEIFANVKSFIFVFSGTEFLLRGIINQRRNPKKDSISRPTIALSSELKNFNSNPDIFLWLKLTSIIKPEKLAFDFRYWDFI